MNELLGIPQFKGIEVEQLGGEIHIRGELVQPGECCPACGKAQVKPHQYYQKTVRHLPWFNKPVYLHFEHRLLRCLCCRKLFMQRLDFADSHRQYTLAYEAYVYELLRGQSIQRVSELENLSWDEAEGILKKGGPGQGTNHALKGRQHKPLPVSG